MSSNVPPWTLGWRLKRSLATTDMDAQEIGRRLGRRRGAISDWMNDHYKTPPAEAFLREWARLCDVSYDWLVDGDGAVEVPLRDLHERYADDALAATPEAVALSSDDSETSHTVKDCRP